MNERLAIVDLRTGRTLTKVMLASAVMARRNELSSEGIKSRSVVLMINLDNFDFIITYLALSQLDAIICPLSLGQDSAAVRRTVSPNFIYEAGSGQRVQKISTSDNNLPPNVRLIPMTSGTSGEAKAVLLSSDNLNAIIRSMQQFVPLAKHSFFAPLCCAHMYGFAVFTSVLQSGGTLLLGRPDDITSEDLAKVIDHKASGLFVNPVKLVRLLEDPRSRALFTTLQFLCTASGSLQRSTIDHVLMLNPSIGLRLFYALTEVPRAVCNVDPHLRGEAYFSHLGAPSSEVNMHLTPIDGLTTMAGESLIELSFSGPLVAKGYLNLDDASFQDGTFYTRDLVVVHGDVIIWKGRRTDVVEIDKRLLLATELEQMATQMLQVPTCAVVKNGNLHILFEQECSQECQDAAGRSLAKLLPTGVKVGLSKVQQFIRTHNGKIQRSEMQEVL